MKKLFAVPAMMVGVCAWLIAVLDTVLEKVSFMPRSHLLPRRTFYAAYHATLARLMGRRIDLQAFRVRGYPRHRFY